MMGRLGVRYFRPNQGAFLPLKCPSRHLGIGQCDNTAMRIKIKREHACIRDAKGKCGVPPARPGTESRERSP